MKTEWPRHHRRSRLAYKYRILSLRLSLPYVAETRLILLNGFHFLVRSTFFLIFFILHRAVDCQLSSAH